jgi:hypothetical protein
MGWISVGSSRLRVASERPADADRGIEAVRTISAQVSGTEVFGVAAEIIELMLADAKLETLWQLDRESDGTVKPHGLHGSAITHLRDIPAKRKFRFEKQYEMASESVAKGLNFKITTEKVARISGASGIDSTGVSRLGKYTAAQVRLIVGRRDIKIRVAADPIVGKEEARLHCWRDFTG